MTRWLIFPLFGFFIFGRVFSYLQSSVPLGYDSGLYLYLFKEYSKKPLSAFFSLPEGNVMDYSPGIPFLGKIIAYFVSPEKFLVPLIIFFSTLLFFSVYTLAKRLWDRRVAFWTVFIFCCSAIQYRVYWYYYLKNIAALSFLLLTINYLLLTSYLSIPFSILVAYFHRPTFALLLVALIAAIIFEKKKCRFYGIVLGSTIIAALIYYIPTFDKTILPLLTPIFKSFIPQQVGGLMGKPSGTFYEPSQALALSILYLPFAIYGFKKEGLKKKNLLITAPLLASVIIVVFRLFFFRRFIIFADIFLIFFAGYGVAEFLSERNITRPTIRGVKDFLSILTRPLRVSQSPHPESPLSSESLPVGFNPPTPDESRPTSAVRRQRLCRRHGQGLRQFFAVIYIVSLVVFISFFIYKTSKPLIYEDELREIKMLGQTEKEAYVLVTDQAYMPWAYGWSDRKVIAPGYGEHDIYWTIPEWHKFWESGDREVERKLLLKLPKPLYIYSGDLQPMYKFDFSGDCFERINWRTFKFISCPALGGKKEAEPPREP